jgi:hypothetical protein
MPRFDETDVEDMEQESSSAPTGDQAGTTPAKDEDQAAAASPADDVDEQDTRSIVRDVVQPPAAEKASSAEGEEEESEKSGEEDDEDFSKVPFAAHPRFQQVLQQRREFKADALEYRKLTSFLNESGVEGAEAGAALEVAALRKVDPVACFERLKPWIHQLAIEAGEILPQDLAQQLQAGALTREAAFLMSRERAKARSMQLKTDHVAKRGERQEQDRHSASLKQAASDWEKGRKLRDPNFAKKLPLMQRELAYLQRVDGHPKTPDEVKAQLKKAYGNVTAQYQQSEDLKARTQQRSQRPTAAAAAPAGAAPQQGATPAGRRPAITPVVGGQVNGNAQIPPSSTVDIVRANRRARA